jgi:GT2 family glycosyltransferase
MKPIRRLLLVLTDGHLRERLSFLIQALKAAWAIRASGQFDPAWYAAGAPRTRSTTRAVLHYVLRGVAEGRSPSPDFDGDWYLRAHPEVGQAGQNPLAHYVTIGRRAGYATRPAMPGLPRQPLNDSAYRAWSTEFSARIAPELARLAEAAAPPPIAIVQPGRPAHAADTLLLAPPGIRIADHALKSLALAARAAPGADLFFADEDQRDENGAPCAPWFKPGFDPELMLAGDLTGPATLFRRALLDRLSWDGTCPDAAALRDLALRAWQAGCHIAHIPIPLFTRPHPPRLQPPSTLVPEPAPLVSIIIGTRDRARLLQTALHGLLTQTDYAPIEILILDNDSREHATRRLFETYADDPRVRVLPAPGPFNWSALNNQGAKAASGTILVLLNNDVEVISPDWLGELVGHARRPGVGAVGARLLYPDRTIQHAGLSLDPSGCFSHILRGAPADDPGADGTFLVPRSVAAITGACLAIPRDLFFAVGGLEETRLGVTGNDIDLCLRLREAGHRVVYAPAAVLVHHEAASRGHDTSPAQLARVVAERDYLRGQWGEMAVRDPYLSPNLCLLRGRPALDAPRNVIAKAEFWASLRA